MNPTTLVLHKSSGESAALTAHNECNKLVPFWKKEKISSKFLGLYFPLSTIFSFLTEDIAKKKLPVLEKKFFFTKDYSLQFSSIVLLSSAHNY